MPKHRHLPPYDRSEWPVLFCLFPLLGIPYAGLFAVTHWLFNGGPNWVDGLLQGWTLGVASTDVVYYLQF